MTGRNKATKPETKAGSDRSVVASATAVIEVCATDNRAQCVHNEEGKEQKEKYEFGLSVFGTLCQRQQNETKACQKKSIDRVDVKIKDGVRNLTTIDAARNHAEHHH